MSCESATKTITAIYNLPEIDDCISKLVHPSFRNDFKQELFLILLGVDCDKVNQMNGSFKYFVVRIILNLVRQRRNVFHKTYLDKTIEYNTDKLNYQTSSPADSDSMQERINRERQEEDILQRLEGIDRVFGNNSYPYHERMIYLIAEVGNMRKASIETGIPNTTVRRIVKKVRNHLQ